MPRAADRPFPTVELHTDPTLDRWPLRPVLAIEGATAVAEWDDPENLWDVNDGGTVTASSSRVGIAVVGTARVGAQ